MSAAAPALLEENWFFDGARPIFRTRYPPGTRVEVMNHFDGSWSRGFEIASIEDDFYAIRRMSDGNVLPLLFADEEVHPASQR